MNPSNNMSPVADYSGMAYQSVPGNSGTYTTPGIPDPHPNTGGFGEAPDTPFTMRTMCQVPPEQYFLPPDAAEVPLYDTSRPPFQQDVYSLQDVYTLQNELASAHGYIRQLQGEAEQTHAYIRSLTSEIGSLTSQIGSLTATVEFWKQRVQELNSDLQVEQRRNQQLRQRNGSLAEQPTRNSQIAMAVYSTLGQPGHADATQENAQRYLDAALEKYVKDHQAH